MVKKNYKHALTGKVALLDVSIGEHPVLGKNQILVEIEEDKTVVEVPVDVPTPAKLNKNEKPKATGSDDPINPDNEEEE